jgi:hypothetical protein
MMAESVRYRQILVYEGSMKWSPLCTSPLGYLTREGLPNACER